MSFCIDRQREALMSRLSRLLMVLILSSGYSQAQTPERSLDDMLFDLERQKEMLAKVDEMTEALDKLEGHLPLLNKLLKASTSADAKSLLALLEEIQKAPEKLDLPEQIIKAGRLLQLAEALDQLKQIDPQTVSLLLEVNRVADLTELMTNKPPDPPSQTDMKLLLVQTESLDRKGTVVVDFGKDAVVLVLGQRQTTPTGFVELTSIEPLYDGFRVKLLTESGKHQVLYQ